MKKDTDTGTKSHFFECHNCCRCCHNEKDEQAKRDKFMSRRILTANSQIKMDNQKVQGNSDLEVMMKTSRLDEQHEEVKSKKRCIIV